MDRSTQVSSSSAVPQDGVQPFDTLLVENSPLTPLSQVLALISAKNPKPYLEHEQPVPLPPSPKVLMELDPAELWVLSLHSLSSNKDKMNPSIF